jgi:hypothetical protein
MPKPRMTKAEKRFSEILTQFLFTVEIGNGRKRIDADKWEMLNLETRNAYLKLISGKTR